ncbi:DUF5819 family protein [Streptacidiphilus sp. ASG 303]|uniref:DUF5819 family protein n=1 Tax=Streptacidiphilus sp. ASG 303 TaxID=2896847 RepID=UPI001E352B28|nr:DUF5819 family protein [Streptacidiphilus sp. ASG 303]MCD0482247.1 DUF5819 family protein [Streptacidiphilus sp. ASG 303]
MEQPSRAVPGQPDAAPDGPVEHPAARPSGPGTPDPPGTTGAAGAPDAPDASEGPGTPVAGPVAGPAAEVPAAPAGRTWSAPALAVLCLVAVLLPTAAAWHLAAVFLHVAPSNSVSQRYQKDVDAWVYPEFEQNWKLFAPNPLQQNIAVEARVKTLGPDGSHHTGDWIGLTAQDAAAIRHNPAPGHVEQNLLRRAWDVYSDSHDDKGASTQGPRGDLLQEYLKRVVLQRVGRERHGEQVIEVQVRSATSNVAPPPWSAEKWSTAPSYREAPWWPVTDEDYTGL